MPQQARVAVVPYQVLANLLTCIYTLGSALLPFLYENVLVP